MTGFLDIAAARAELYERAQPTRSYIDFVHRHGIDVLKVGGFCGALAVVLIVEFPGGFFDFAEDGDENAVGGVVCEAIGFDSETVEDLVAWPVEQPGRVLSMYRRAPLVGMWQAMNPCTYTFGRPLNLHRHPLDWLKAGCNGAAIVVPQLAARALIDLPGRFAPQDREHAHQVDRLIRNLSRDRMVVPRERRIAA